MYIYLNNTRIGLNKLFPVDWQRVGKFKLGFSAFYVHTKQDQILEQNPTVVYYKDCLFTFLNGIFEYPSNPEVFTFPGEQFRTSVQNIKSKDALLFICFKKANIETDDNSLKQEVGSISTIISLYFGCNLIRDQIAIGLTTFELHDQSNYSVTGALSAQILDFDLSGVNLSIGNHQNIGTLISSFEASPEKNKITLCANWYLKSFYLNNVDNFIAKWIALETLCMEDSSNIYPIKLILGEIYGMTPEDAANHFCIGRIYGLRSEIVHNGYLIIFKPAILDYLGHIIEDCLNKKLGNNPANLAERTLANFDLNSYLDQIYTDHIK